MLMRLSNIANFLAHERNMDLVVQYVVLNSCKSNLPTRFYLSRINADLSLNHVASFGFSEEFVEANKSFSLLTIPLLNEAINSNRVMIRPRDIRYFQDFHQLKVTEEDPKWESTVFIPLLPNFAAILNLRVEPEESKENLECYELLRSILNLYLNIYDDNSPSKRGLPTKTRDSDIGTKLSERQELILQLIRSGMTNNAIAKKMGYSESLIRQETMAIYRKLGVDGRRTLINRDSIDESPDDESHGIKT